MASSEKTIAPAALTPYELQRLANVHKNQALIASLGILDARAHLQLQLNAEKKIPKRSPKKIEEGREEPIARRRSLRILKISEDTQKDASLPLKNPAPMPPQGMRKRKRAKQRIREPPTTDAFISHHQGLDVQPSKFSLQEKDARKVATNRILSAAFLPTNDRLVLAVGDRNGKVGIWDVDCEEPDEGVHLYKAHKSAVFGISVSAFDTTKVFTCSNDKSLNQLDIDTCMLDVIYTSKKDERLFALCCVPDSPHCLFASEGEGYITTLDTRKKDSVACAKMHQKKINTIDVNVPSPWLMVTSSTDATVSVWDVRKLKHARNSVAKIQHRRTVLSAQFSPSGSSIASCSYDNTVAVMKVASQHGSRNASGTVFGEPFHIPHYNINNRWIPTFRAIWGWDDEHVYVGSRYTRTIDVLSTTLKTKCYWLSSIRMTTIPCRLAAHPLRCGILAGCSGGGQAYVWRQ